MTFIRTSKILFKPNGPNGINQGKLNELASFIDLCNVALNFYLVNFIECYELDKLFAIKNGTKMPIGLQIRLFSLISLAQN